MNNILDSVEVRSNYNNPNNYVHFGGIKSTRNSPTALDKSIYDEIKLGDDLINKLNTKIRKFNPTHRAIVRGGFNNVNRNSQKNINTINGVSK